MDNTKSKLPPQLFCPRHMRELKPYIEPVINDWVKPHGGLWTSTYTPDEKYCSDWIVWCVREEMYEWVSDSCYILYPNPDAKILTIDSKEDLKRVIDQYHIVKNGKKYLDYERISKDFDAIHLTERGQWDTRLLEPNLYGWDCESTLWFRNKFLGAIPIEKDENKICLYGSNAVENHKKECRIEFEDDIIE